MLIPIVACSSNNKVMYFPQGMTPDQLSQHLNIVQSLHKANCLGSIGMYHVISDSCFKGTIFTKQLTISCNSFVVFHCKKKMGATI